MLCNQPLDPSGIAGCHAGAVGRVSGGISETEEPPVALLPPDDRPPGDAELPPVVVAASPPVAEEIVLVALSELLPQACDTNIADSVTNTRAGDVPAKVIMCLLRPLGATELSGIQYAGRIPETQGDAYGRESHAFVPPMRFAIQPPHTAGFTRRMRDTRWP